MSTQPDSGNYSDSGNYQPDVDYSDSGNYQVSSGEEGVMSGDPHLSPLFGEKYDI